MTCDLFLFLSLTSALPVPMPRSRGKAVSRAEPDQPGVKTVGHPGCFPYICRRAAPHPPFPDNMMGRRAEPDVAMGKRRELPGRMTVAWGVQPCAFARRALGPSPSTPQSPATFHWSVRHLAVSVTCACHPCPAVETSKVQYLDFLLTFPCPSFSSSSSSSSPQSSPSLPFLHHQPDQPIGSSEHSRSSKLAQQS